MKTGLFMTMAAAVLVLAGCSNDENGMVDNGPVELRLTSGVTVQQTRAYELTQEKAISKDEVVSVWVDDAGTAGNGEVEPLYQAVQLTANGSNGFDGEVMYFPQNGNNINIYAIHGNFTTPFSQGNVFPTNGADYEVEADQSKADKKAYTKSDLLYATKKNVVRTNANVELTFYHMLSKLELAIKVGKGRPQLATSNAVKLNDVTINGKFKPSTTATMGDLTQHADILSDAETPSTGKIMTLGQQICENFEADVVYNEAILVPQSMENKKLTFELANGNTLTYTIPASTTFESGKKYQYHITLDLTGITVTSKIEEWKPANTIEGSATM